MGDQYLSPLAGFFFGVLGGVIPEFLGVYRLRKYDRFALPRYYRDIYFWIITIVAIVGGGLFVVGYIVESSAKFNWLIAMNIGATAPLAWESIASLNTDEGPGTVKRDD
jgi:hypothetical protein